MAVASPITRGALSDYLSLTKPRIVPMHLITSASAMFVAARGLPSMRTLTLTLVGGGLAVGAANALNCYFDRDVDGMMSRTCHRPLPQRRLEPYQALAFGLGIGAIGLYLLSLVNLLAAALAGSGLAYYILIYTLWLKRNTNKSVVIGGLAGAVPPLIGWVAVTGSVDPTALILSTIIFLWTMPHFWALALWRQNDYQLARLPVLPTSVRQTKWQILLYSLVLVCATLVIIPAAHMGSIYLGVSALLGICFIYLAINLLKESTLGARQLYFFSIPYLALLFTAMVLDRMVFF
jgi:heme o synthase